MLAAGSGVAFGAKAGEVFTLFAPSGAKQRLLVVRARPAMHGDKANATLEIVRTMDLGFPGNTKDAGPPADSGPRHLVYHPRLPLLYFSEEQSLGVSIYRRGEDGRLGHERGPRKSAGSSLTRLTSRSSALQWMWKFQ